MVVVVYSPEALLHEDLAHGREREERNTFSQLQILCESNRRFYTHSQCLHLGQKASTSRGTTECPHAASGILRRKIEAGHGV